MLAEAAALITRRLPATIGRLILVLVLAALLTALAPVAPLAWGQDASTGDTALPEWTRASLTQDDVGLDFILVQEELLATSTAASYTVRFDRLDGTDSNGPFQIGSVIIHTASALGTAELDTIAETLVQLRTGLVAVDGPRVADEARWYAGPWSAPDAEDEGHVLASLSGNAVIAVGMAGLPGTVSQADVAAYANLLWERLAAR
jgi:hypothetical protein